MNEDLFARGVRQISQGDQREDQLKLLSFISFTILLF